MGVYTAILNELAEAARLEAETRTQAEEAERRSPEPVEKRLVRLLATIPADEKAEGLSITALQHQLRARGRGHMHCHIGELGNALRRLGYIRKRNWRPSEGFVSRWFPAPKASA
jgi:hypothetical protein